MAERDDQELARQAELYPIGRVLRSTYDAENHDSLGQDLTGLMLELARIEPPAPQAASSAPARPRPPAPTDSWWRRLLARLLPSDAG